MDARHPPSDRSSVEVRQLTDVLALILWAIGGIFLFVFAIALHYGDRALLAAMLVGTAALSVPAVLLRRQRLRASAFVIVLIVLGTLTTIATVGQGIRDMAVIGFPLMLIFAALTLDRSLQRVCVGLAILAVCWLAMGETFGWFVTRPFQGGDTNWFYLIGVTLILLIAAFGVDQLSSNIRTNLARARSEIANRKTIEERLEEEKILLRTLIDSLPDRIYAMDAKGTKILSNTADWRASGGKTMEDVLGKTDFETYPHDLAVQMWALDKRVMDTGVPVLGVEEPGLDPEGKPVITLTSKVPLRNAQSQIVGLVGSGYDITDRKRTEEALRQSEAQLRALFASMHDVVLVIDVDGLYRDIAPTNPELLVKPPEQLLGGNLRDVFPPQQAEFLLSTVRQVLETKQTAQIEYDLVIGDRTVRFETSISPMTEDRTVWVAHDITARRRSELIQEGIRRIAQAAIGTDGIELLYRSIHAILVELIPTENFYISLYDPVNELLSFPYFVDQYDEKPAGPTKVEGLTGYVIRTGAPLLATREVLDRLVAGAEVQPVGPTGEDWMGAPLRAAGTTTGVVAMQSYKKGVHFSQEDLNLLEFVSTQVAQAIERKRMEEEIRSLSLTDELTGLYNRRGFTLLAEQETMLAARVKRKNVLLYCDLDDLKSINDRHGHAQGDAALKEVSSILKETCRESDILARIGGDEFVVFAVDVPPESAPAVKQRIQRGLEERNLRRDGSYALTLSMGMARFDPDAPRSVSEMIAEADGLMYAEKQAKKRAKPGSSQVTTPRQPGHPV